MFFVGPEPLLVFIQTDPWAMLIGMDTPRVVLYADGQVIFTRDTDGGRQHYHARLDTEGLAHFHEHTRALRALKTLRPFYNVAPALTSQPRARFYLRDGSRRVLTNVYGLKVAGTRLAAWTVMPTAQSPDELPPALLELHQWLCDFSPPGSELWTPKYVEVCLWDYSYAPEPSIQWPAAWPSLTSDRAVGHGDRFSIFLDGDLLPELRAFLATQNPRGAIEVAGKKWAVAYRLTFPSEPVWLGGFAAGQIKQSAWRTLLGRWLHRT